MNRTRWIAFVVICVVVLGGLVVFSKKDTVNVSKEDPTKAVSETATSIGDHVTGNTSSKVVLIEYGDFQCPYCGQAYPQLSAVKDAYKDKIAFMFRNFPITTAHPNALAAATAAEAASLQGKYWVMYNKLYQTQQEWSTVDASKRTDVFAGYAQQLGLNADTFKSDLSDPRINEKINRDRAFAKELNITSTPTLYIGDKKLDSEGVTDLVQSKGDKLRDALDAALKAVNIAPPPRQ
jgi:protein-disulfide isomerase